MAIGVKGKIVRSEDVEGRKDLVALAINYNEAEVPMSYKMHINNYLSQLRKTTPSGEENAEGASAKTASGKAATAKQAAETAAVEAAEPIEADTAAPEAAPDAIQAAAPAQPAK